MSAFTRNDLSECLGHHDIAKTLFSLKWLLGVEE